MGGVIHTLTDTPMSNETPKKALIRQSALCVWLDLSRSGLDKLRKKDSTFPKPIKDGNARQAAAFYVFAEVEAWLQAKIASRDAA